MPVYIRPKQGSDVRKLLLLPLLLALSACSSPPQLMPPSPALPDDWSGAEQQGEVPVADALTAWLVQLNDPQLQALASETLHANPNLQAARFSVQRSREAVVISGADRYPGLSLDVATRRNEGSKRVDSLNFNARWELDLWGRLSARQQQAQLELGAAEAGLQQQEQALVVNLSKQWFALQEARLLQDLYRQRRDNLQQNVEVIESGYRQGLNDALDLYLARNNLHAEAARVEQQAQQLAEVQRELELLLGRYPAAQLMSDAELPWLEAEIPAGLPSDLLTRRPDLQQRWLDLLAADAALAAAHRDRFPSLSLTNTAFGGSSNALSDLLSLGNLSWSIGASLTQTLFDAGRKEALQAQALARRQELEQRWLEAVYAAFAEVENALSARQSLLQRHAQYLEAQHNAIHAESLAFEQYQKGLNSYTTVLEAQRRSFDAQTSVLGLRRQLLQNRVELYRALGGTFQADNVITEPVQEPAAP
jgi:NodT family efflux transporter outer membrane factor (OMF) lipoprotein